MSRAAAIISPGWAHAPAGRVAVELPLLVEHEDDVVRPGEPAQRPEAVAVGADEREGMGSSSG